MNSQIVLKVILLAVSIVVWAILVVWTAGIGLDTTLGMGVMAAESLFSVLVVTWLVDSIRKDYKQTQT